MSNNKNKKVSNPAKGWFTWRPSEGRLGYWDATSQEKKTTGLPNAVKIVHTAYTINGIRAQIPATSLMSFMISRGTKYRY